jgi:hypothetical protein
MQHKEKNGWFLLAPQNPDRHCCVIALPFRLTLLGHSPYFKTFAEVWRLDNLRSDWGKQLNCIYRR